MKFYMVVLKEVYSFLDLKSNALICHFKGKMEGVAPPLRGLEVPLIIINLSFIGDYVCSGNR